MRAKPLCTLWALLLLLACAVPALSQDNAPVAVTEDQVLDPLKQTLAWFQQARGAMQTAREASIALTTREDEITVVRVLQRAFDVATLRAALVAPPPVASNRDGAEGPAQAQTTDPRVRRAERRAQLEAAIRSGEQEVARLRERAERTPRARREAVEREAMAAANRLALERLRLEFLTSLQEADATTATPSGDLMQEIQALRDAVPELASAPTAAPAKPGASPASKASTGAPVTSGTAAPAQPAVAVDRSGTLSIVNHMLGLQRARATLSQIAASTHSLRLDVEADATATRDAVRALAGRLREQVGAAGAPVSSAVDQAAFRRELDRLKALGAVLVPLRAQSTLLQRLESDIRLWQRTIDRDSRDGLRALVLSVMGVVIALAAIAIGAMAWRLAVQRYVQDPYRRRLALRLRKIAIIVAVVLVLVLHFTSELTALVTALGFAAAGIAFALQNVILSVAGYFSMMAPDGIRVGDRVSLQGPYGYAHGEVIEIGLVRIRLRELTPDGLEPTGRIVVSPNSVVFTGSFLKHPPAQAKAA
jgi:hypothetical protein